MRISDWSSDVCSSDLALAARTFAGADPPVSPRRRADRPAIDGQFHADPADPDWRCGAGDALVADAAGAGTDGYGDPPTHRACRQRPSARDLDRRSQCGSGAATVGGIGRVFCTTGTGATPSVIDWN